MPVAPKRETGDYQKMGMGNANLYIMYNAFNAVMMSFGVAAAVVPLFATKSEHNRAKVKDLALRGVGPAYLSYIFSKICGILIGANLGTARRDSGVNVPDQHIYKVADGPNDGGVVLMDDEGDNGRFNRAQRAVGNMTEQSAAIALGFLLNMQVFPKAAASLFAGCFAARVVGAIGYTRERKERMKGQMLSQLCSAVQDGMVLVAGLYATYIEFKK